jgi:hypothetical protein
MIMTDEAVDRFLEDEPSIAPSRGFTDSVMQAVDAQADQSGSIPFPWRRIIVGLGLCLFVVIVGVQTTLRSVTPLSIRFAPEVSEALAVAVSWLSMTLAGTYALTWISRRWV